jgi:Sulfatase
MKAKIVIRRWIAAVALLTVSLPVVGQPSQSRKTRNVIVIMSDGLRWQEVFGGADSTLLRKAASIGRADGNENASREMKSYSGRNSNERRRALMPFLWSIVAQQGQLFGNRKLGSNVEVTNGLNISFPGYSEILTGVVDARIDSNDKNPNPNESVLEWLNRTPQFAGRVAAFGAWDAFPAIFNSQRCGFPVNSGYDPFMLLPDDSVIDALNRLKTQGPKIWDEEPFDAVPYYTALEYMKQARPRVLFIGLGETDDWAHANNYPEYLNAAHRADQFLQTLWQTVQSTPEYRDSTTIIFTSDHGRGDGENWTSHGKNLPESKQTWLAVIGPDTEAQGERRNSQEIRQTQLAATVAALLGEEFTRATPNAGSPILDVFESGEILAKEEGASGINSVKSYGAFALREEFRGWSSSKQ